MRSYFYYLCVSTFLLLSNISHAVTVQLSDGLGNPDVTNFQINAGESLTSTVRLLNESISDEMLLFWQLSLRIEGVPGSIGSIDFFGIEAASNSLFSTVAFEPMEANGQPIPSTEILVQHADTSGPFGQTINASAARNIVDLILKPVLNTSGDFRVILKHFEDGGPGNDDPMTSSMWTSGSFADMPFSGGATEDLVLATIHVAIPEPCTALLGVMSVGGLLLLLRQTRADRYRAVH